MTRESCVQGRGLLCANGRRQARFDLARHRRLGEYPYGQFSFARDVHVSVGTRRAGGAPGGAVQRPERISGP